MGSGSLKGTHKLKRIKLAGMKCVSVVKKANFSLTWEGQTFPSTGLSAFDSVLVFTDYEHNFRD